jgi:hypothetical protein
MSNALSGGSGSRDNEKRITNEFINAELGRLVILKQRNVWYPADQEAKEQFDDSKLDFQEHLYETLNQRDNLNEYTQGDFQSSMFVVKLLEHLNILFFEQAENQCLVSAPSTPLPIDDVVTTDSMPQFSPVDNKAFVYINDDKEICGFCITYARFNHEHWMMAVTKNSVSDSNEKEFHYWISPALQRDKIFKPEKERFNDLELEKKYISAIEMRDEVREAVNSEECYKVYERLLDETFHLKIDRLNDIINHETCNDHQLRHFIYGKTDVFTQQFIKSNESEESLPNHSEILNTFSNKKSMQLKGRWFILADIYFITVFSDEIVRQFFYHQLNHRYYYQMIVFCYPILMSILMIITFCIAHRRYVNNNLGFSKIFYMTLFCIGLGEFMVMFSFTQYSYLNEYGTPVMFFIGACLLAGLRKYSNIDNNQQCIPLKIILTFIQAMGVVTLIVETLDIQYLKKTSFSMKATFSVMLFLTVLMTIIDVYKVCQLSASKHFDIDTETIASFPSTTSSTSDIAPIPQLEDQILQIKK